MKKIIILSLFLSISVSAYAETIAWIGPITVVTNKFVQKGGVFGFTYSLDQGDCCCGGPSTEDSYPQNFQADDTGNIIISDHDANQVLLFLKDGTLKTKIDYRNPIRTKCDEGRTGFIWPGWAGFIENNIFINTGYCTAIFDYNGKMLWSIGATPNSFPDFLGSWDKRLYFKKYSKEPYFITSDEHSQGKTYEDGWLVYDLNGKFIEKTTIEPRKLQVIGNSLNLLGQQYQNIVSGEQYRRSFFQDKEKNLYVLTEPEFDFEENHIVPSGKIDVYDRFSVRKYTLTFPLSKFFKVKRTCSGEGYVAFAGRDVIEEYAKGVYVSSNGEIHATLYLPDALKIIKWIKLDLDTRFSEDILGKLSRDGLRLLLNEIYARRGRTFKAEEMKAILSLQPWYKPDPKYTDQYLTAIDRYNINLIIKMKQSALQ